MLRDKPRTDTAPLKQRHLLQRPLLLTPRDHEILKTVFDHRVLTSDAITLLIPGSQDHVLRRLHKLSAHRYLTRHARIAAHLPYVYQTGPRAVDVLPLHYGVDAERVKRRAAKLRPDQLQHGLMVSRLQAAATRGVATRPDVDLVDCIHEDELPAHPVAYQDGFRLIKTTIRHDLLLILAHLPTGQAGQERRLILPVEADRSTEPGRIIAAKVAAYDQLSIQEREKARRGEPSLWPFRVLWVAQSAQRTANLRQHAQALNQGKGTGMHWYTTEESYADPQHFFAPIWHTGRAQDTTPHHLLESRSPDLPSGT